MEDEDDNTNNRGRSRNPLERMFGSFMPNLGSIGSIFSFAFWGLIFAGVAYFVLKNTRLAEGIPDEWKAGIEGFLNGMGMSLFPNATENLLNQPDTELAELVAEHTELDAAQSTALAPVLREHRAAIGEAARAANGHSNPSTLLNAKTIIQLMRTRPDIMQAMLAALPAPAAGAPAAIPSTILEPIKTLVNDRAALNSVLTNADARRVLATAILRFTGDKLPFKAGSEQVLADFIHTVGMNGGSEVTDHFVTFLGGLTTALETNNSTALTKAATDYIALAITNPAYHAQTQALIMAIDVDRITDPALKKQITDLQNPAQFAATAAISADLGVEKAQELQVVLNRRNNAEILAYMIDNPDARAALQANRETVMVRAGEDQRPALEFLLAANTAELTAGLRLTQGGVNVEQQRNVIDTNKDGRFTPRELMIGLLNNPELRSQWTRTEGDQTVNNLGALGDMLRQPQALRGLSASDRQSVAFLTHVTDGKYKNLAAFTTFINELADNTDNFVTVNGEKRVKESAIKIVEGLLAMAQNPNDPNIFKDLTPAQINAFFADAKNNGAIAQFLHAIDISAYPAGSRERRVLTVLKQDFASFSAILRDEGGTEDLLNSLRNPGESHRFLGRNMTLTNTPGWMLRAGGVDNSIVDNAQAVVNLQSALDAPPAATPRTQGAPQRTQAH